MNADEIEQLRGFATTMTCWSYFDQEVGLLLKLIDHHARLKYACMYALQFFEEYDVDGQFHPSLKNILRAAVATQQEENGS